MAGASGVLRGRSKGDPAGPPLPVPAVALPTALSCRGPFGGIALPRNYSPSSHSSASLICAGLK